MWKPTNDICIVFDDKTGANRTEEEINLMISKMREIMNDNGFDLNMWGTDKEIFKSLKMRFNA